MLEHETVLPSRLRLLLPGKIKVEVGGGGTTRTKTVHALCGVLWCGVWCVGSCWVMCTDVYRPFSPFPSFPPPSPLLPPSQFAELYQKLAAPEASFRKKCVEYLGEVCLPQCLRLSHLYDEASRPGSDGTDGNGNPWDRLSGKLFEGESKPEDRKWEDGKVE